MLSPVLSISVFSAGSRERGAARVGLDLGDLLLGRLDLPEGGRRVRAAGAALLLVAGVELANSSTVGSVVSVLSISAFSGPVLRSEAPLALGLDLRHLRVRGPLANPSLGSPVPDACRSSWSC